MPNKVDEALSWWGDRGKTLLLSNTRGMTDYVTPCTKQGSTKQGRTKQGRLGCRGRAIGHKHQEKLNHVLVMLVLSCMWVVFIIPYAFISPIYFKIILITTMTDARSNKQMRVCLPPQIEIHPILMMLNHLSPPPTAPAPHTVSLVLTWGGGAIPWQRQSGAPVPLVGAGTDPAGCRSCLPPPREQTSHPQQLVPLKEQRLSRAKVF